MKTLKYKQKKIGTTFKEFEDLLENGCADNANINYNPEMIVNRAKNKSSFFMIISVEIAAKVLFLFLLPKYFS